MSTKTIYRLALLTIVLATLPFIPARKAEAAYGIITYVRFDWYKQTNGTYNINVTYCVDADSHAIYQGETYPGNWNKTRPYGYQKGCVTRYLFTQVSINDHMYANFLMNPRPGDGDEEAHFTLARTGDSSYRCELNSSYLNGLKPVDGRLCAWTK